MVKAGRIMRTVIEPESNQTTVLEQKLSVGKKLLSVNSPDLCRKTQNNAIFSPLHVDMTWLDVCPAQQVISMFGSFFIHSSLSSSILPEGTSGAGSIVDTW